MDYALTFWLQRQSIKSTPTDFFPYKLDSEDINYHLPSHKKSHKCFHILHFHIYSYC